MKAWSFGVGSGFGIFGARNRVRVGGRVGVGVSALKLARLLGGEALASFSDSEFGVGVSVEADVGVGVGVGDQDAGAVGFGAVQELGTPAELRQRLDAVEHGCLG